MWRTRAVLSLLHEEVAGLPRDESDTAADRAEAMARARRRAGIVVALDWAAIVVLVVFGELAVAGLSFGPSEQTIFTLTILAVAVHSGFRLGQLDKLRAVDRAAERLVERDPDL